MQQSFVYMWFLLVEKRNTSLTFPFYWSDFLLMWTFLKHLRDSQMHVVGDLINNISKCFFLINTSQVHLQHFTELMQRNVIQKRGYTGPNAFHVLNFWPQPTTIELTKSEPERSKKVSSYAPLLYSSWRLCAVTPWICTNWPNPIILLPSTRLLLHG